MKPHELIAALMEREKLGALPLAKRMKKPSLQPQIHRYINGRVANPARSTAVPLAAYFNLPVDAIYDEKIATTIAKERGVEALPVASMATKRRSRATPEAIALTPDELAVVMAYRAQKLKREQVDPTPAIAPTTPAPESATAPSFLNIPKIAALEKIPRKGAGLFHMTAEQKARARSAEARRANKTKKPVGE